MQAAWPAATVSSLQTTGGNPGQFAQHPGGAVNAKTFAAVNPTDAQPLKFSIDIFDDGTSANKRMTAGIRAGASNIVELGFFNAPSHFAFRVINFSSVAPSTNPNWVAFDTLGQSGINNVPNLGWHRITAMIGDTTSTFTLDRGADGSIEATHTVTTTPTAAGFTELRFGGPSGLASAGGGAGFDNILLEQVIPEPASLGLLAMGAVSMLRRRRA